MIIIIYMSLCSGLLLTSWIKRWRYVMLWYVSDVSMRTTLCALVTDYVCWQSAENWGKLGNVMGVVVRNGADSEVDRIRRQNGIAINIETRWKASVYEVRRADSAGHRSSANLWRLIGVDRVVTWWRVGHRHFRFRSASLPNARYHSNRQPFNC